MKKRLFLILTIALTIWIPGLTVSAASSGSAETDTGKSKFYTISFLTDNGTITADGNQCGDRLIAERSSEITYEFRPRSGYELSAVFVNDRDMTDQIINGTYAADPLSEDITLRAVFVPCHTEAGQITVPTGEMKTYLIILYLCSILLSVLAMILVWRNHHPDF